MKQNVLVRPPDVNAFRAGAEIAYADVITQVGEKPGVFVCISPFRRIMQKGQISIRIRLVCVLHVKSEQLPISIISRPDYKRLIILVG